MKTGVYIIQNKKNKKVYVGSAVNIERRWREHKRYLKNNKHHSPRLQHSWNKWGEENFQFIFIEPVKDPAHLVAVEQTFLDYYKSYDPEKGYNICPTAGSCLGKKHSEEAKKKLSEAHKGKTLSEETRKKMSEANKGKTLSEETKKKISEAKKNMSEETRKKLSEASRGKTHSEEARKKISEAKKGKGKGYTFNKAKGKYRARIRVNGKQKHIGYYTTPEEARRAYLDALAMFQKSGY